MVLLRLVSVFALGCCLALPASAQVGVTSAAAGQPRGTPPAQNERVLRVGIDVQASERIVTGIADRAHLVFLDGSALTVGPNSDLTIDRFVYDPATRTGDLAMNATRGAFRYVGGAISKKSEVVIRTPTSNIAIRGGIMIVAIGADGSVTATFLYGDRLTVSNPLGTSTAIRPGSQISVAYGGPPQPPIVLPPGTFQAFMSVFEGALGGGVQTAIADEDLLRSLLLALTAPAGRTDWLTLLQTMASQGITTTNANRPPGSPPPAAPAPPDPGQGQGCPPNCS